MTDYVSVEQTIEEIFGDINLVHADLMLASTTYCLVRYAEKNETIQNLITHLKSPNRSILTKNFIKEKIYECLRKDLDKGYAHSDDYAFCAILIAFRVANTKEYDQLCSLIDCLNRRF